MPKQLAIRGGGLSSLAPPRGAAVSVARGTIQSVGEKCVGMSSIAFSDSPAIRGGIRRLSPTASGAVTSIAHVIIPHGFGGAEKHVMELAEFQADDHQVVVILGPGEDGGAGARHLAQSLDPRVSVVWLPSRMRTAALFWKLLALCPDIVHAHLNTAARRVLRCRPGCPRVVTLHNGFRAGLHERFDGIIRIADYQAGMMPAAAQDRSVTVHNWVLPQTGMLTRTEARAVLGLPLDAPVIGGMGRLELGKGFDVLVAAYARLRAHRPDARLVLFGQGTEMDALRQQVAQLALGDHVVFAGFRPDVRRYLSALDLGVVSSRHEPFGLTLLEYADAGVTLVATRTGGPLEILGADYPFLCPPEDAPAMAETLLAALEGRVRAPRVDLARFRPEVQMAKVGALYAQLAGAQAPVAV
ncbi:glycosyltransferase [Nitrospirillum sp. BR 11828]|uniref:glycosyltransferase n=1 Tax=Nitrospirillum sp. BR 11828 TaxID=3104325 RepID=UPI002ACADCB3|nr:glycosyltransferase [Nitrospirillum sp. BR 11828]MDZ5649208.1 glycosyltransferase [Nitrospirillum sp. BR 11828]